MNRIDPWRFGAAAAIAFSLLFTLCALAFALAPEGTLDFFNSWFHGLDLRLLRPQGGRALTIGQYVYGLVGVALVGFVGAAALAALYDLFSVRSRPR
jgi:hypothetical protein